MLTNNTTARTTVKPLSHFKYVFLYALYRGINHVTLHVGFGTGNVPRRLIPSHHHPRRRPLRCRTPWQMPTPGPSQGGVIVARHPNDTTSTTTNHRQPLPTPHFLSSLVFSFPFAAALAQPRRLSCAPLPKGDSEWCLGKSDRPQSSVVRESEPPSGDG